MKNITITIDEKLARWARIRAAEREMSLSRLIGEMLKEKIQEEDNYAAAMQDYLSRPPQPLKKPGEKYPHREELHG